MGSDSHVGIDGRVSRQQRRQDDRRVREARQKAKAIDEENDQKREGKKGKDKKSNEEKKRKKGKAASPVIGFIRALRPTPAVVSRRVCHIHSPPRLTQPVAEKARAPYSVPYADAHAAGDVETVPRVLTFVAIKRIDPRLPSTWGHWWVEVDGRESYGWWPLPCPLPWHRVITGSRGTLNGLGTATEGTPTRDPYHGDEPDHCFHPTLVVPKSDDQVRADVRAFARSYVGGFQWGWWWLRKPAESCRTFQWALFKAVGLVEEQEYLYTHGPGCPFMYPFRSVKWRVQDILAPAARVGRRERGRLESPPLDAR